MNRSFCMYSAILLLLAPITSYLNGQDAVVSRLPEDTAAFVYVNDLSSILSVFSETTFVSSFEESPLGDLTKQLVEIAMESDELSELNDYILTDVEFGETFFALIEGKEKFDWVFRTSLDINSFNPKLEKFASYVTSLGGNLGIKNVDGLTLIDVAPIHIVYSPNSLVLSSNQDLAKFWIKFPKERRVKKSLRGTRKYRSVLQEVDLNRVSKNSATIFIDTQRIGLRPHQRKDIQVKGRGEYLASSQQNVATAVLDFAFGRNLAIFIEEMDPKDLLGIAVKVEVGSSKDVDFDISGVVLQAQPRRGFHAIFKLRNGLKANEFNFPDDVDFALLTDIDFDNFVTEVQKIEKAIKPVEDGDLRREGSKGQIARGDFVEMRMAEIAPMLGSVLNFPANDRARLDGKLEGFGWMNMKKQFMRIDHVSSLRLKRRNGAKDLQLFLQDPRTIEGELGEESYKGVQFVATRPEVWQKHMKIFDKYDVKFERAVFTSFQNRLSVYSNEKSFQRIVNNDFELLSNSLRFRKAWRYFEKNGAPGLFQYTRWPTFLWRPHSFVNLNNYKVSLWLNQLRKRGEIQDELLIQLADSFIEHEAKREFFPDFGKRFGPSGFAVYETGTGFKFQFSQFKK